jgi:release factor glutamine methyltransferase
VTVLDIIQRSTDFLKTKGVESPRLQSESILAHVLAMPRMQLYLNFERKLSESQIVDCRDLVKRRGNREPLQHLLGTVSFCGLELCVGPQALIPRPETEQLVEQARAFLAQLNCPHPKVLDFGTGSGCIAVALAVQCPSVHITALDISTKALELARGNAAAHGILDRVTLVQGDGVAALALDSRFDLIISNPPYVVSAEIDTLQAEVRDFDPRIALDGGSDGLDFYRLLATQTPNHLNPAGGLAMEFGDGQASDISTLLEAQNWIVNPPLPDYSGRERFLIARLSS